MQLQEENSIEIIEKNKGEGLIPVLQKLQEVFGYLPREVILKVSQQMKIPLSKVYGVITFYSYFSLKRSGKYVIRVCKGTACHVKGGEEVLVRIKKILGIEEHETSQDFLFTLETVACVGACALAPVIIINDKYFGKMNPHEAERIINHYKSIEKVGEYAKDKIT